MCRTKRKTYFFHNSKSFFRIPDAALYIHILLRYTDDDILPLHQQRGD